MPTLTFSFPNLAFSFPKMVVGICFYRSVQAFRIMREDNIGFDKFTTGGHGIIGVLLSFPGVLKTLANAIGHGIR